MIDLDVRFQVRKEKMTEIGFERFLSPFSLELTKVADIRKLPPFSVVSSSDVELLREAAKSRNAVLLYNKGFQADVGLIRDLVGKKKAFEIPVAPLLESSGIARATLMTRMRFFIKQCVHLRAPIVITSQARDSFGLKSPHELIAIGEALGLTHEQAEWAISETPEMILHAAD